MTQGGHAAGRTLENVTARAGRFVAGLDAIGVPEAVQEKARACVLYGFGIGLLCTQQATAHAIARGLEGIDGVPARGGATVLASGTRLAPSAAAAANAVMLHSRCQEDTSGTAHLGVVALPIALAFIEAGLAEPADFLPAVIAGYEVAGAFEAALGRETMRSAFRASSIYGTLAAAATTARLLRLPAERVDAALSNALQMAGGTLQSIPEGTDEWRYQLGAAVRTGILAASLAREGSVSARAAAEGPQGFAVAFARRSLVEEEIRFGEPWRLPDVTFKPYPVCAHNQSIGLIGAQVHERAGASRIQQLRLRINPYVVPGMLARGPFTRVAETLMSSAFVCATACLTGSVSLDSLARYDDADVARLMQRIAIELDESVPFPAAVAEVTLEDGRTAVCREDRRFSDFSLGRAEVLAQLRRLAAEERVPPAAVDPLDAFAFADSPRDAADVLAAFALARNGARG